MKFKLSLKAEIDLIEIWEYTFQNWSIEKANQYVANLFSSINSLCNNPKVGKNYEYIRKDYLGLKVNSHIIFFKIEDAGTISIIRILHEKMDLPFKL
jgi:toxin ParE1/3/4